jgi:hypothetical protein
MAKEELIEMPGRGTAATGMPALAGPCTTHRGTKVLS